MGERTREIEKLNTKKFQLIQKRASGEEYIDNLYKKTIGNKEDREGIITDVKQIKAIPFLPPTIVNKIADTSTHSTRLSPINASGERSRQNRFLSPLSQRTRSVAPNQGNGSTGGGVLAGLLDGISTSEQQKSPSGPLTERRHTTYGESGDFSELKVKARRYQTPQRTDGQPEHITSDQLRYLNAGKMEKETIRDYIQSQRDLLMKQLNRDERKKDIKEILQRYKRETQNFHKQ